MTKGAGSPANILVFLSIMPEMTMAAIPEEVRAGRDPPRAAEQRAGNQGNDREA